MENPLRLFIAIELSKEVHERLASLILELQRFSCTSIKWVRSENIHLTMKFLGDTDRNKLARLQETIRAVCCDCKPFQLHVAGTGVFPNRKAPRVLWVGMDKNEPLEKMAAKFETAMEKMGYPMENRPFSPHLTLARVPYVSDQTAMENTLKSLFSRQSIAFGSVKVRRVTLFQSTLAPGGAIYTPIAFFQLQDPN